MDIRYFTWLDRLKRGDIPENECLRGEMDNRTRPLTGELGVRIPPGAPKDGILPAVDIQEMMRLFDRLVVRK